MHNQHVNTNKTMAGFIVFESRIIFLSIYLTPPISEGFIQNTRIHQEYCFTTVSISGHTVHECRLSTLLSGLLLSMTIHPNNTFWVCFMKLSIFISNVKKEKKIACDWPNHKPFKLPYCNNSSYHIRVAGKAVSIQNILHTANYAAGLKSPGCLQHLKYLLRYWFWALVLRTHTILQVLCD